MTTSVAEQTALAPAPRTLSDQLADRGVTPAQYHVLTKSLYPGAKPESALMVLDYCAARKLDPMKKPCHIVPMKVKVGDDYEWRDVVLPGIYEYRTTAMRTGLYLGHTAPVYGEVKEYAGVMAPESCSMTFKRAGANGVVIEFPVTVYFREVCNTKDEWIEKKKTGRVIANDRWAKAPIQMLTKCAEAAGLREAFPDEFGGEQTFEEMAVDRGTVETPEAPIRPAQRVSEQQPAAVEAQVIEPVAETVTTAATGEAAAITKPATALNVGTVATVEDRTQGDKPAAMVTLNTGFRASTRDGAFIRSAVSLRDRGALVELVTKASADPSKYAPSITEIVVIESGEVSAS